MAWRYESSTGVLTSPDGSRQDTGYSGQPPHVNDTSAESMEGLGPIPRGRWLIGPAYDDPRLGPLVMHLDPSSEMSTFNRSLFRIHGDNASMDQTASDGCIILPRAVRELIAASPDRTLVVF